MTTSEIPSPPGRRLCYFLIALAAFAMTIALFYAEEDWRGWRAMENCKGELEAQGISLDWTRKIPAPVPDNENVFGVPEMQKWFVDKHPMELSNEMAYPGYDTNRSTARLTVAELTIGLPGASAPGNSRATVLQWGDPRAKAEAARLIKEALGPAVMVPLGFDFILRQRGEIQPAQIFLQCQTAPTEKELLQFLPKPIVNTAPPDYENIQVEPMGNGSYKVTMLAPIAAAEFLKWSQQLEPEFALIRKALQRPYARMNGDYSNPSEMPIPNYVVIRKITQRLATRAESHLLLGQPEEALRDLTLIHDICRIPEEAKPMTLVSAMINVAVRGMYASVIADGLRLQAWREPQLAALQGQLKQINLVTPVKQGFEEERFSLCHHLATDTPAQYFRNFDYGRKTTSWTTFWSWENSLIQSLIPRGWAWQNMVTGAHYYTNVMAIWDPAGRSVFPDKAGAASKALYAFHNSHAFFSVDGWSLDSFMIILDTPNFTRAAQRSAENQTVVNQALIACALERYHLAHGGYPETLDALVPQFIAAIPGDVIGGQPPHYRRNSDGTFLLYSQGWSEKDPDNAGGKSNSEGNLVWPEVIM